MGFQVYDWGWSVLNLSGGCISCEEEAYITFQALRLYYSNGHESRLSYESLEGRLITEGKRGILGNKAGQIFNAEVYNSSGTIKIKFILSENARRDHREVGALN